MILDIDVDEIKREAMNLAHNKVRGQHSNNKVIRLCQEIERLRAAVKAEIDERNKLIDEIAKEVPRITGAELRLSQRVRLLREDAETLADFVFDLIEISRRKPVRTCSQETMLVVANKYRDGSAWQEAVKRRNP